MNRADEEGKGGESPRVRQKVMTDTYCNESTETGAGRMNRERRGKASLVLSVSH